MDVWCFSYSKSGAVQRRRFMVVSELENGMFFVPLSHVERCLNFSTKTPAVQIADSNSFCARCRTAVGGEQAAL